jgi:hypothetical protein
MSNLPSVLDANGTVRRTPHAARRTPHAESECLDIWTVVIVAWSLSTWRFEQRVQGVLVDAVAWRYSLEPRVKRVGSKARR